MELFRLFGTIAIDNTEANNALDDTTTRANDSANETESAFAKIGGVAKNIALGIGAAGLAIGGAFIGAVEGTREYRTEMGLLESAFLTAGHSSEEAKSTYSELNAILGDSGQAVEASQHLAKLVDNEKDLSTWTDICAGIYSTFGESIPLESITESANEVAKSGVLTGGLVDALVWAGHSEEEFQKKLDSCTTEQERQKLIMDTLNGTYKDASAQYKETNKDIIESRKAQERLSDAMAEVGRVGEPIMTAIKNAIAGMAEKAVPVIVDMVEGFKNMVTWVQENESTVKAWVGVILGAITTIGTFILIMQFGAIMGAAANAIKVVRTAILGMNAAMLANPIGLIVALLAGLVVAFIYLWNNVDGFKQFWVKTWELIQKKASEAWKWIEKTFSNIGKWFTDKFTQVQKAGMDAMDKVKKWFSDSYKGITSTFSNIGSWFGNKFSSAWNSVKNAFSNWGSFFSGLWSSIKSKFGSVGTSIGTAMGNAVKKGMNGALSLVEGAINKGIGLINSAIRLANNLPGIDVGTVSKINLPRLAKGGVLERGQVGILEGTGAEAVVPLERNTEWIDKVAAQFNNKTEKNVSSDELVRRMNRIIELLEQMIDRNIYLDSGVLVGELAPAMDSRLGRIYAKVNRGRG